jgi:hypothetical protein
VTIVSGFQTVELLGVGTGVGTQLLFCYLKHK